MIKRLLVLIALAVSLAAVPSAYGRIHRSKAARAAFMRTHPCPANGHTRGSCPGYVVDHIVALCKGGADAPSNMQWQTIAAAKAKDKIECK